MESLKAGLGLAPLNIDGWPETKDGTPLVARCLVLDDGHTRLGIVSATVIEMCRAEVALVRQAVSAASGLPVGHILFACTHVHSGPPTFSGDGKVRQALAQQVARAAADAACAASALQPVRLGWATDHLPGVSRVRRILRRDGNVVTLRRAWPQYWGWATDPQTVGPEEPLDDRLTVLRIEDLDGHLVGAVMHFTCHPIPDFFGYAARMVEQALPGAVCLILNGCSGSVDTPFEIPMRGKTQAGQLPILGDILGHRTLELLARAEAADHVRLGVAGRPVFLPLDPRFVEKPDSRAGMWAEAIRRRGFDTEVQCLAMGDVAFAGVPGEAQVGFGREIEKVSPFRLTRAIGIANDECGYLLTEEARARGGYEADPQLWGVVTGQGLPRILSAIAGCLAELKP
ncbi:MAG: hypothetical protein FJ279_29505 [Planctomycetes bacterium]|nr:hypothetical protein [Planctomycetota bacterium]